MADEPQTEQSGVKSQPNARERARSRMRSTPTPRAASPTRSIEPGLVHFRIAQGLLEGIRERAASSGLQIDVGEFPDMGGPEADKDDPQRLVKIVAHAVARIGDKFAPLRKFSRNMEGQEKRAGLLSDLSAALYTLWKRNPDAAEKLARGVLTDVKSRQAQRPTSNGKPASTPQTTGVTQ